MDPATLFFITGLVASPIFVFLLWKISARTALIFLGADFLLGVWTAFFTIQNIGGGFGIGVFMIFFACFAMPFAALLLAILWIPFSRALDKRDPRRALFLIGGIVLVILQSAPIAGQGIIGGYCDAQIMRAGDPIVRAAQQYKQERGDYPRALHDLVQVARPSCFGSVGAPSDFAIERCADTVTILRTRSFDGARDLRYNFATGNWSGVSFLDGACNFLR
ncbi:MAG: hypothetical protein HZC40_13150 [Chloroflexi bacterium]|nr:hypothetical protein [Chloroflexota bacterium]